MTRIRTLLGPACVALALAACSRTGDFERMRLQHRGDPFGSSGAFADRAVMRVPPGGTVAFGASDDQPAIAADTIVVGRRAYDAVCAVCHGAEGSGQSPMTVNMPLVAPPPLNSPRVRATPDADLFAIVSHGRNRMPAYDWSLPASDRWAIVAYLRTLEPR